MRRLLSRRRLTAAAALSFPALLGACAPSAVGSTPTLAAAAATATTGPAATPPTPIPATPTVATSPTPVLAAVEPTAVPAVVPSTPTATAPPTPTAEPTAVAQAEPATTTTIAQPIANDATTMLIKHRGVDLGAGQLDAVVLDGDKIMLARRGAGYANAGSVTSAEIATEFAFDTLVPSWNATTPAGTRVQVDLRVRQGVTWSRWYALGRWSANGGASVSGQKDAMGSVDVDTLKLARTAQVFQYRAILSTTDPRQTPTVRLVAVNYANLRDGLSGTKPELLAGWAKDLPVPVQSQLYQDSSYARVVCSPTSLAMVLQYWGANLSVADVVRGVRDATTRIYGNWPLNTAFAATRGLEAYVDRFHSIEQLQNEIAADRPVVTSIRFGPGELSNATLNSTGGHLLVVRGFTAAGDVIVNDPWAPKLSDGHRVYRRAQFANAWLRPGGIVYLVRPLA